MDDRGVGRVVELFPFFGDSKFFLGVSNVTEEPKSYSQEEYEKAAYNVANMGNISFQ